MPHSEPPVPNALILADDVFRDVFTGKWIISGVFSQITARTTPVLQPQMVVFFQVTNVSRPVDLRLRIEHSDGRVLLDLGGPIKSGSPLEVIEHRVIFRNLRFPEEGKYWVQLMSDEEVLTAAPLSVLITKEKTDA